MMSQDYANRAIESFNARDHQGAREALQAYLSAFAAEGSNGQAMLPYASALRIIAFQTHDVKGVLAIDDVLRSLMGEGIRQFDSEQDTLVRAETNKMIASVNEGREDEARELIEAFLQCHEEGRSLHHLQLDCVEAINNLCARSELNMGAGISGGIVTELVSQKTVAETNKQLFPSIDPLAIDFPYMVTIETFSKCNAKCTFCPYPMLEAESDRSNLKMPEERFLKIIDDLKDIPPSQSLTINLSRVNEPLLDNRIYDFIELIERELPGRNVILPSNGSTLTQGNVERLASLKPFRKLYVSMNSDDRDVYEKTMGIPYDRTVDNLDRLHEMKAAGNIKFGVSLTAVMGLGEEFDRYQAWAHERFPLFEIGRYPPTNWFGLTDNPEPEPIDNPASCKDWYQVHILADGREALCCFDALGQFGGGNIDDCHLLDLYNKPWQRDLRRYGTIRQSALSSEVCQGCWYM